MIRLENDLISLLQSGDYWQYNYPALMRQGFTEDNAILMSKHGIPHHFLGFEFFDIGDFKTHEVSNETYIQIGIFKATSLYEPGHLHLFRQWQGNKRSRTSSSFTKS
ncbi:hypothetical protein [Brevibacillus sp. 179-C9.3 HS]|uniref:hypothetical protein n=1 Tax=unclassified Brevibacillus TaxID=2684853 RepID=UPI0039A0DAB5